MNMESGYDSDGYSISVDFEEVQMEINARSLLMSQEREQANWRNVNGEPVSGEYDYRMVNLFDPAEVHHSDEYAAIAQAALQAENDAPLGLNEGQGDISSIHLIPNQQGELSNSDEINHADWPNLDTQLVEDTYAYNLDPFDPTASLPIQAVSPQVDNHGSDNIPYLANVAYEYAVPQHAQYTQEDSNTVYTGSIHCKPWSILEDDLDISSDESMKELSANQNGADGYPNYGSDRYQLSKIFDGNLLKAAFPLLFDNMIRRGRYNHSRFNWLSINSLETLKAMEKRLFYILTRLDEPIYSVLANRLHLEMDVIYAQCIDILGPGEPDEL